MKNSINYWSTSSQVIVEEAEKLGLKVEILKAEANLFIVHGPNSSRLFKSTDCGENTSLGMKISGNKELTSIIMEHAQIPQPKSEYFTREQYQSEDLALKLKEFSYPLVIKPVDWSHGDGVRMDIRDLDELKIKMPESFEVYATLIVQEQIVWMEFRVLVLFGEAVLAIERRPASVAGDWIRNVQELIEQENSDNLLRGDGYQSALANIEIDTEVIQYIEKRWIFLDTVIPLGEHLQLRGNSNLGTGWTPHEITSEIHPEIRSMCEAAAAAAWLGICWVDVIARDHTKPVKNNAIVLELNSTPGLGGDRELTSVNTPRELLIRAFGIK